VEGRVPMYRTEFRKNLTPFEKNESVDEQR